MKRRLWALSAGLALLALLSLPTAAGDPVSVGLTSYRAVPQDNAVRLEWHTETEVDTVAYLVRRSTGSGQPLWLENLGLDGYVLAEGGPAQAADYVETDSTAVNGTIYTYVLFEIESDSSEVELAAVTVTAGIPTPTPSPTPIVINVNPPPSTVGAPPTVSTASATPSPTITPSATASSSGAAAATATPRPAVTATARPAGTVATGQSEAPVTPLASARGSEDRANQVAQAAAGQSELSPSSRGVAVAQVEQEATTASPYPAPDESGTDVQATPYPGELPALPVPLDDLPYPLGQPTRDSSPVSIIGSQSNEPQAVDAGQGETGTAARGRLTLWAGFILASLVFVAGVVGSILLFTRKRG